MRFAPSQHQSGLLSAFFGLHSIGLFSSAVAGLSAACAIVLPRLPVMRTDVVMAPRAFHPVSLSRLSLAPAAKPQPKPMLSNPSLLFNRSLDFPDFLRTRGLCTAVAPWFRRRWFSNQGLVSSWSASFESASAYVFVVSMVTASPLLGWLRLLRDGQTFDQCWKTLLRTPSRIPPVPPHNTARQIPPLPSASLDCSLETLRDGRWRVPVRL